MNNSTAKTLLDNCREELEKISKIRETDDPLSPTMRFLTMYALIRACGSIECSYKTIIADFCEYKQGPQVKRYLTYSIRENSRNPSLKNITTLLHKFDENWYRKFKNKLDQHNDNEKIKASLNSLNNSRNQFAHGKDITISFEDVKIYFEDACIIINILDDVVDVVK